jgi:hypothetical protein
MPMTNISTKAIARFLSNDFLALCFRLWPVSISISGIEAGAIALPIGRRFIPSEGGVRTRDKDGLDQERDRRASDKRIVRAYGLHSRNFSGQPLRIPLPCG